MNRTEKAAVIDEIAAQIKEAEAVFVVDYRGITVTEAAALRAKLRDADATFRVVKNSLTERAADQVGADDLKPLLAGPSAFAFVRGDAALAAKALADFARTSDAMSFKGGVLGGSSLSPEQIAAIAKLPAREVLYGMLVGTVAAPISGLVRGLNALIAGLAIQLRQIADQGLVSGAAPEAEAEAAPVEAEAPAAEAEAEAPADEEAPAEEQAAPEQAPAQDDNQADASAEADDTAEAKEN